MPSQSLNENRSSGSRNRSAGPGSISYGPFPRDALVRPIQIIAFWTAIALPFLHIPLLLYGLETTAELYTFFGLVALNLVALFVGHGYNRT